jgi:hypothetical protein
VQLQVKPKVPGVSEPQGNSEEPGAELSSCRVSECGGGVPATLFRLGFKWAISLPINSSPPYLVAINTRALGVSKARCKRVSDSNEI